MDTLLFSAGALSSAAVAALYALQGMRARVRWKPERAQRGLANAARIVQLIAHVQQHRGMSGAWLAGDRELGSRLPGQQAAVAQLLGELMEGARREDTEICPCFVVADVARLRGQWDTLVAGLPASSPERSFLAHCRIVSQLLDWLGALGEARIEQPLAGRIGHAAVHNFSRRLPLLAECLGQMRALATTAAARGECSPVMRVRLQFLVARVESLLAMCTGREHGDRVQQRARTVVEPFIEAVRVRLLDSATPKMNATECFDLGTRAVDGAFDWQERERREIETELFRFGGRRTPPAIVATA